jgi:hypothetical protein
VITSNTCAANANFSLNPTSTPQYWNAIPASPSNVTNAVWSWGDGASSYSLYTSHQYSTAGTYDICLSVTVACGASASYCAPYYVYKGSGASDIVNVDVIDPATVGLSENKNNRSILSIYPNPASGEVNVTINGLEPAAATLSVFNIVGSRVYVKESPVSNGVLDEDIDLKTIVNGVYFIQVTSGTNNYTKKIVINK